MNSNPRRSTIEGRMSGVDVGSESNSCHLTYNFENAQGDFCDVLVRRDSSDENKFYIHYFTEEQLKEADHIIEMSDEEDPVVN